MNIACATKPPAWEAKLDLRFERSAGRTVLADRRHSGPLVVQKALYPEGGSVCHAVIVHPPGGIAGGDRLEIDAALEPGAHALITTPGATRWYRSAGPEATQSVRLRVAAGATLEWLPQETIYFESCCARNCIEFEVEPGGRLLAWEIACLGRVRTSERFARGAAFQNLTLNVAARPRWTERGWLEAGSRGLATRVGLGGRSVIGTALFHPVPPRQDARLLERCRAADNGIDGATGLTVLGDILVGRYLGDSAEEARAVFAGWWAIARPSLVGCPAVRPRIWST